jgi:hypothetical protein
MKLGKSFWVKLGIESLLIVFSVLLALALNEYMSVRKEEERTRHVLISIREELRENEKIIRNWHQIHQKILKNIAHYRNNPQAQDSLVVNNQFQFNRIFSGTVIPNLVRSTAWETAKSNGTLQNLDLSLANTLSDMYDMQAIGVTRTADKLIALIYERETHEQERVGQTLVMLEIVLSELVGQESYLLQVYDDVLKKVNAALEE